MKKNYSTEIRETYGNKYLKVFFANSDEAASVQKALKICNSIKNVNVTHSDSCAHKGDTLTIYPKPMFTIEEVEKETIKTLDSFFQHMVIVPEQIVSTPVFKSIKASIKEVLCQAINTIYVCVAWFTDDELLAILESKRQAGVDVKVITYNDGINGKHGVEFGEINHKAIKADRGGIMHRKYCVIDNHIVISGSYNWTDNAAERNDENILIVQDWETANQSTREFLDTWSKHD